MHIVIGAYGWQHKQWQGQFYPDDIPLDWCLSYYANEFDTLLVPFKIWSESELEEIQSWIEEVPESFDLFFEVDWDLCNDNVKKKLSHELLVYRQAKFTSKTPLQSLVDCESQRGSIPGEGAIDEKIVLLHYFSENIIKLGEIRQLIEEAKDDYRNCESLYLFFDQALLDISVLNNAKIIADLLVSVE